MLHQSSGGGGKGTEPGCCHLSAGLVVCGVGGHTSHGWGCPVPLWRAGAGGRVVLTKIVIPRGQKHGGLGAPAHDFGVTGAVGYLCHSEDLQGVWMDLSAGLWLISA